MEIPKTSSDDPSLCTKHQHDPSTLPSSSASLVLHRYFQSPRIQPLYSPSSPHLSFPTTHFKPSPHQAYGTQTGAARHMDQALNLNVPPSILRPQTAATSKVERDYQFQMRLLVVLPSRRLSSHLSRSLSQPIISRRRGVGIAKSGAFTPSAEPPRQGFVMGGSCLRAYYQVRYGG